MAKIITHSALEQKRKEKCFKEDEVMAMRPVIRSAYGSTEYLNVYSLLEAAFEINPNKFIHQKQMAKKLGYSVKKINEFIADCRSQALTEGRMIANSFGAGYKMATEQEAIHEMAKGLQRIIAHARSFTAAINETSTYNWDLIKNTPLYNMFIQGLRPASMYMRGFVDTHEKIIDEFKLEKKLLESAADEVTRPLFRKD